MPQPTATTQRLLIPVVATKPTFCAKALIEKPLKMLATEVDSMSARRPLATVFSCGRWPSVGGGLGHDGQHQDEHRDHCPDGDMGRPKWKGKVS
jgi:hypothetical protein